MGDESELRGLGLWKAHQLTGDRKGVWSLFVTASYRMTFRVNAAEREIYDVDFEDYR